MRLSLPLLGVPVPKKRVSRFMTRRRHLLQFIDHYRFLFRARREHLDRRRLQEPMYVEDYVSPTFRFPGFWPESFGYQKGRSLSDKMLDPPAPGAGGRKSD
ncbi:unnamed protein product [Prorocentrum cordatum]|uniref:Uncharacterized protein n=1 Tax=Prorocentrum cordatum TaxID=2364126 RepID=A0ABN9SP69_9DINO|nr:unnamed protein product [Polarella glacialis]|mmetsp:Transcript_97063/g.252845  ORF Transcript_97063/g.252845 Transcript_97063/m.252845 type:complete len:101 (+) Transcript_97063:89-391(+)